MCSVDKDASVLWSDDWLDYGSDIINVGQRLDAEKNVVEGGLGCLCRLVGTSYNYDDVSVNIIVSG